MPDVSVIVLAFRTTTLLDRCLWSLHSHNAHASFETIVVANGATPEVYAVLERHPEIRLIQSRANRGFAGGCNLGARHARGHQLVFLNDDVVVHDGWLDGLRHAARTHRDAGAVGSLVLNGDGVAQEFGSVVDPDLSPHALDIGISVADAQIKGSRHVPYASACSMLVDRGLFEEVGGFDELFYPAYFEDPDLAWRIWEAGRAVMVTPFSCVSHLESSSSTSAVRDVIFEMNAEIFEERWSARRNPVPTDLPRSSRRVVVFEDFVPRSASGSGLSRSRRNLEQITDLGVEVSLFVRDDRFGLDTDLITRGVTLLDDPERLRMGPQPMAVIASRPYNLTEAIDTAHRLGDVPVIYDAEARFSARLETRLALDLVDDDRAALTQELAWLLETEKRAAREADAIMTISLDEAEWFRRHGAREVLTLDPFPAVLTPTPDNPALRGGAVFPAGWLAGSLGPNYDGARWLLTEVLPILRTIAPGLVINITGSAPPEDLVALGDPNVRFVGEVPDIDGFLDQSRLAIAPLRYGAGIKLKVVDALSRSLPLVSTSIGAEGLDDKWREHIIIRDDPAGFAEAMAALACDNATWRESHRAIAATCDAHRPDDASSWGAILSEISAKRKALR